MENPTIILLVFGLLLSTPTSHGAFDYFQFVQEWPRSYCDLDTHPPCQRSPLPDNFTVHGLWPESFTSTKPCPARTTYHRFIKSGYVKELDDRWTDLELPNSTQVFPEQKFWNEQWIKHGACSKNLYAQKDYFDLGIRLKDRFYLLKILHESTKGINPGMTVNVDDVRAAIKDYTGKKPKVKCILNKKPPLPLLQLAEIIICVDPAGDIVFDCPGPAHISCYGARDPGMVYFPRP